MHADGQSGRAVGEPDDMLLDFLLGRDRDLGELGR